MRSIGLLVGDAEGCLQRVECAAADGVASRDVIAGVSDVAGVAKLAGALERGDDVTLAELGLRATMKLDQVDAVGLEPLEAAPDALEQGIGPPVFLVRPFGVTAFGEEAELLPPRGESLADQLFALKIAFGRVDDVEPGVQGIAEEACHGVDLKLLETDLSPAEAERAHLHVRLAEPSRFHLSDPWKEKRVSCEAERGCVPAEAKARELPSRYHTRLE